MKREDRGAGWDYVTEQSRAEMEIDGVDEE